MTALDGWDSFYVIAGTAAGALIGLQFVALTLIAERPPLRIAEGIVIFVTPTIVHFSAVLFLSAVLRAPWHAIAPVATVWGLVGLAGATYAVSVARHMRANSANYQPVFEDWLFHPLLPFTAYAMLVGAAYVAHFHARPALFLVGAAALLLLFIGIHNVWDNTTDLLARRAEEQEAERHR